MCDLCKNIQREFFHQFGWMDRNTYLWLQFTLKFHHDKLIKLCTFLRSRSHFFSFSPNTLAWTNAQSIQLEYYRFRLSNLWNEMKCFRQLRDTHTDYIQANRKAFDWNRWYLTFVHSSIAFLSPFNLHGPFVDFAMVCCLKALICCVGVRAHS